MSSSHARWLIGIVGIFLLPFSAVASIQDVDENRDEDTATIVAMEAIDVGVRQWRDALNVKCEFRFRQGLALSLEDAIQGKYPTGDGDRANCRFVKMGDAILYDFQIEGEPDFNKETKTSTYSSFFLASVNQVEAYASRLGPHDTIVFSDVSQQKAEPLLHRRMDLTNVFPFVLMGGNSGALFQSLIDSNLCTFTHRWDGDQLMISSKPRIGQVTHYTVDNSGRFPLLKLISSEDGNDVTIASDFIELKNGCLFPGRFVVATGPVVLVGSSEQRWLSRIWEIADSSVSDPAKEDFVIDVDPIVKFAGLKPMERPVNMLDITLESLSSDRSEQSPTESLDDQFASRASGEGAPNETEGGSNNHLGSLNWNLIFVWAGMGAIVLGGLLYFAAQGFRRK